MNTLSQIKNKCIIIHKVTLHLCYKIKITMTQSQTKIKELTTLVNNAITATLEGRQTVINSCKELYNLIEQDVYNAGREWMLKGMYNDLCNGNFSEPFYCELKKDDFGKVVTIYNERILPNL